MNTEDKDAIRDLLSKWPPGSRTELKDFRGDQQIGGRARKVFELPSVVLFCPNEECSKDMTHEWIPQARFDHEYILEDQGRYLELYRCRHCEAPKLFALTCVRSDLGYTLTKLGELPEYGPHTPPKLLRIIQPHRELFLKGRQCEIHNQGIGAFSYYRRIVELSKNEILDCLIEAASISAGNADLIQQLNAAKAEIQFSKAIANVKEGLPDSLLLAGHNPLTILHDALSEGLHDMSDEECLENAIAIREVLISLVGRVAELKAEQKGLAEAVQKLANRKRLRDS